MRSKQCKLKLSIAKHNFCVGYSSEQADQIHLTAIIPSHLVHQFLVPFKNPGITVVTDRALISGISAEVLSQINILNMVSRTLAVVVRFLPVFNYEDYSSFVYLRK